MYEPFYIQCRAISKDRSIHIYSMFQWLSPILPYISFASDIIFSLNDKYYKVPGATSLEFYCVFLMWNTSHSLQY
jgi:hypothetical protein